MTDAIMAGMASTVRAFWGPRPMPADDGAARIVETMRALSVLDNEVYGRWFLRGRKRHDAMQAEVLPTPEDVTARLTRNRTDVKAEVMPELGYTFTAWNGATDDDAVEFVATFSVTTPHVRNVVNVGVPDRIQQLAPNVLDAVRQTWLPDEYDVWSPTA